MCDETCVEAPTDGPAEDITNVSVMVQQRAVFVVLVYACDGSSLPSQRVVRRFPLPRGMAANRVKAFVCPSGKVIIRFLGAPRPSHSHISRSLHRPHHFTDYEVGWPSRPTCTNPLLPDPEELHVLNLKDTTLPPPPPLPPSHDQYSILQKGGGGCVAEIDP